MLAVSFPDIFLECDMTDVEDVELLFVNPWSNKRCNAHTVGIYLEICRNLKNLLDPDLDF